MFDPKLTRSVEPPLRTTRHVGIQKMHDLKYAHAYILSHNLMRCLGRNTFSIGSKHLRLFLHFFQLFHFPAINQLLGILTLYAMEFREICLPYVQLTPLAWCLMLNSYTHEKNSKPWANYQLPSNRKQNSKQATHISSIPPQIFMAVFNQTPVTKHPQEIASLIQGIFSPLGFPSFFGRLIFTLMEYAVFGTWLPRGMVGWLT